MDITRIDSYYDNRFSQNVLNQHGAYVIEDEPYEIEIISKDSAVIRGKSHHYTPSLSNSSAFMHRIYAGFWMTLELLSKSILLKIKSR